MRARTGFGIVLTLLAGLAAQPAAARTAQSCPSGSLRMQVAADRHPHLQGRPVRLRVRVRNLGASACAFPTGSCLPEVVVTDRAGTVVWDRAQTQVVCAVSAGGSVATGGSAVETVTWDGTRCAGRDLQRCPGTPVPPGRYAATAAWGGAVGRARLTIRP